jgi:hypothetical protein
MIAPASQHGVTDPSVKKKLDWSGRRAQIRGMDSLVKQSTGTHQLPEITTNQMHFIPVLFSNSDDYLAVCSHESRNSSLDLFVRNEYSQSHADSSPQKQSVSRGMRHTFKKSRGPNLSHNCVQLFSLSQSIVELLPSPPLFAGVSATDVRIRMEDKVFQVKMPCSGTIKDLLDWMTPHWNRYET